MKKFNLSLVAILAMSTFAIAGGDIAPVEPVVETPYMEPAKVGGFYIGAAYGWNNLSMDHDADTALTTTSVDADFGAFMIDAGYKFNPYIAVEGRYSFGISSSNDLGWTNGLSSDVTVDSWGLYVKPMYPVTDAINIYALLGYGSTSADYDNPAGGTFTSDDIDGFSWGIGADYAFTDNWAVFIDYSSIVDDEDTRVNLYGTNVSVDNINFGVNYTF
ncbi:MAG: porin family protein [Sulfurovum sp.]|jgi:opacity protein-like surface antigen|uniref:porin family protein n=1 Tax=Sulfurovum sp. TaxID=1969726 RepID=UPI003C7884F2